MIVIDYVLYYFWCLFVYKILTMVFKRGSLETCDYYGIGVLSLGVYFWLYINEGGFVII